MPLERRSHRERIESEDLIDVSEWAQERGMDIPLPFPVAATRSLWDLTDALPFGAVGRVTVDERVMELLRAAARAFERCVTPPSCLEPASGFVATFAARLPSRAMRPKWCNLMLICESGDVGVAVTLALAHELDQLRG